MFIRLKHPVFRVCAWELVEESKRLEFERALWEAAKELPFFNEIVDVEIVGSYATGCAQIHSDIDVNIALVDWPSQKEARRILFNEFSQKRFFEIKEELSEAYQVNVGMAVHSPDLKSYVICYSTKEQIFYNRRILEFRDIRYSWDINLSKWAERPKRIAVKQIDLDPFLDEVPYWQDFYGSNFQCLS